MDGTVIKQIREDKNLTLEATYFGVCSKTNAIAFEQGKRMLAADKFIQVLDNLLISLDEFMWIANDHQLSTQLVFEGLLKHYWNTGQLPKFEQQLQLSKEQGLNELSLASFRLLHAYATGADIPLAELELVERYFAELSLWTLADLKLFANISCALPFELMENLLAEALKAKRRYRNYPQSNALFATLLINCLEQTFAKDRPELSQSLLEQLSEFTAEAEESGYRLFERYYQALYEYRYGELKKGKEELIAVQKVARFLDAKLVLEKSEEALK
ncbi:MAG TPA: hypothetical protein DCE17_06215 [Lactobacillus sp.]|uniref:Rgg/GadR/MutR family transcriptional regulator n=1 Tax=Ligilactobacillus murinus TaxID=1622 RepID=UPI00096D99B0|nr:Rgg/GadR/MutR family transcriptional regulator [Ligilactobacillus murinus]HAB50020.1 hypothetical protein [Lactobacillus sp.]HAP23668.1 Rgg/GadR/MutR family transcriptional regulator [Lactobacillus sp.]